MKTPLHLSIIKDLFIYIMIGMSYIIYTVHKLSNIFVFWRSFPKYKNWLMDTKATITGVTITLLVASFFVHTIAVALMFVLYICVKSYDYGNKEN